MPRPIEVFFHMPVSELTNDERAKCLALYALYFNRDGLQKSQLKAVINDWITEHGSQEATIEVLRARVQKSKGHG